MNTLTIMGTDQKYLRITGPQYFIQRDFKALRAQADELLSKNDVCRVMHDFRGTDISAAKILCIDDIAMTSKYEMPHCKKLAIIGSVSALMDHYVSVNACCEGVELQLFDSTDKAEGWLLS